MDQGHLKHIRQTVVGGFSSMLVYLRGVLVLPILTRALGPEDYGVWVQLLAGVELMASVAGLGLSMAMMRMIPAAVRTGKAVDYLLSTLIAGGLAGTVAVLLIRALGPGMAGTFLGSAQNSELLMLAAWLVPLSVCLTLVMTHFRARSRMGSHTLLAGAETSGWFLLALHLLSTGGGLPQFVTGLLTLRAVVVVLAVLAVLVQMGPSWPTFGCLRQFVSYGLPLVPLGIFTWLTNASDRYVIAYFSGPAEAGIYAVSYAIGSLVGMVFAPVFTILLPTAAGMWDRGETNSVSVLLRFSQRYPLVIAIPLMALLTIRADWVVSRLATQSFTASPALIGLTAAGFVALNLGSVCETSLSLCHRTVRILAIWAVTAALNVGANLIAVPLWGAVGAAATTALTCLAHAWLIGRASRGLVPFAWELRTVAAALGAIAPGALLLGLARDLDCLTQVALAGAGLAIYVGLLMWLDVIGLREWQVVKAALGMERGPRPEVLD